MKIGHRFFFHPVLTHPRSRFIFILYLILSSLLGILCWVRVMDGLAQAGVSRQDLAGGHSFLLVLMSPLFRWALIVLASWFAAGVTAHRVVGPIERLELWLNETLNNEKSPAPFRLRKEDAYYKLVVLISKLLKST